MDIFKRSVIASVQLSIPAEFYFHKCWFSASAYDYEVGYGTDAFAHLTEPIKSFFQLREILDDRLISEPIYDVSALPQ